MINTAHIGVSYKCNMNCTHCFVNKDILDDSAFFDSYKEIIDYLYKQGLCMMFYTYGEPLASDKFYQVAKYASSKHICQVLMTNGYLIQDFEMVNKLKNIGIKQVYVSIDSVIAEKHDENRRKRGAWNHAINAIELLVKHDMLTGIACTITNENYQEMEELYNLAEDLKVKGISLLRCREEGKIVKYDDNNTYIEVIKKLVLKNKDSKMDLYVHDLSLIPMFKKLLIEGLISENEYIRYESMCLCHKKNNINIAPNGDVYECDFSKYPIGNIKINSIGQIIEEKRLMKCTCENKEIKE